MADVQRKVRVLGTSVHVVDLPGAVEIVVRWITESRATRGSEALPPCRYVVTPNLDHAVMLRTDEALQSAYSGAALTVADGMPLVWMSRIVGDPLPGRVPGSDLVPRIFEASPAGTRVYLLGAAEDSSLGAAASIQRDFPHLNVVGRLSPPFGFERSEEWSEKITSHIRQCDADVIVVGLGAPKQETWVARHAHRLPGTTVLCAGATIDFLSGAVQRAPVWAQKTGLEWLHRMVSDPKRLIKRYTKDAAYVPLLIAHDAWSRITSVNAHKPSNNQRKLG